MKYQVYGRRIEVLRTGVDYVVFALGTDGKKRIFNEIFIPSQVREDDVAGYLEDLLHEWATPRNSQVIQTE